MNIRNCAFLYGDTENVLMIIDGALPEDRPTFFRVEDKAVHLYSGEDLVFSQENLMGFLSERLKNTPELGLVEMKHGAVPNHVTKVAYHMSA